jgi:hypothetical protein
MEPSCLIFFKKYINQFYYFHGQWNRIMPLVVLLMLIAGVENKYIELFFQYIKRVCIYKR